MKPIVQVIASCLGLCALSAHAQQAATHRWSIRANDDHCWIEASPASAVIPDPVGGTTYEGHKAACDALKAEFERIAVPDVRSCKHVEPCTRRRCGLDAVTITTAALAEGADEIALTTRSQNGGSCTAGG